MLVFYKSELGEIKSYEEWKMWAEGFYRSLEKDLPFDWLQKLYRVLKLEKINADESYTQYPEYNCTKE